MSFVGIVMTPVRWVLGKTLLCADAAFTPTVEVTRTESEQSKVNVELKLLSVYQFESCPFCIKVRRALKRMNLEIEFRDAKTAPFSDELLSGGGEEQVPCLRITEPNGQIRWMYESDAIIEYLDQRFVMPFKK